MIKHQISCIDTSQQNGQAKWDWCPVLNMVVGLLSQASLPIKFNQSDTECHNYHVKVSLYEIFTDTSSNC